MFRRDFDHFLSTQAWPDSRPRQLTVYVVKDLVQRLYGLRANVVKELDSYVDRNYLIQAEANCDNPHIKEVCPDGYVLKILNSVDSKSMHHEAEHRVQDFLVKEGFSVPVPVRNVFGQDKCYEMFSGASTEEGQGSENDISSRTDITKRHVVRLFTFIPGVRFKDVPWTTDALLDVGKYGGKLDRCLQTSLYDHPSLWNPLVWDLRYVPILRSILHVVTDDENRRLVEAVVSAFERTVVPVLDQLPKGLIHGDFGIWNIIVSEAPQEGTMVDGPKHCVRGIVDFGHLGRTYCIFEMAITIAYIMIGSNAVDPLKAGGHVLAGYLTEMELSDLEWQVLKECVAGRFAQSLVIGAYTHSQQPWNEYNLATSKQGWQKLRLLMKTPKSELYKLWRNVIESHQVE